MRAARRPPAGRARARSPPQPAVREEVVDALVRPERALKQLKSWASTSVVKGHRARLHDVAGPSDHTAGEAEVERDGRHDRHHETDPEDAEPHLAVDDPVAEPP